MVNVLFMPGCHLWFQLYSGLLYVTAIHCTVIILYKNLYLYNVLVIILKDYGFKHNILSHKGGKCFVRHVVGIATQRNSPRRAPILMLCNIRELTSCDWHTQPLKELIYKIVWRKTKLIKKYSALCSQTGFRLKLH